jgi:crotonobetainyl-CoA:carnitine CoA-transferase CaiB-like acyl-CoA transferase
VVQNFRPGVIKRLGLDYASAKAVNPGIVYASITGYGEDGPWALVPGQDLLAQARTGVMWLNGGVGAARADGRGRAHRDESSRGARGFSV